MDKKFEAITANIGKNKSDEERKQIQNALEFCQRVFKDQLHISGKPYFVHSLRVVKKLINFKIDDHNTVLVAILHDILQEHENIKKEIKEKFGEDVERWVDALYITNKVKLMMDEIESKIQKESQKKNAMALIVALTPDIRVLIIKFIELLDEMALSDKILNAERNKNYFMKIANESLHIYAPLAHRLGMREIQEDLQDFSFKILERDNYNEIQNKLNYTHHERQRQIDKEIILNIRDILRKNKINVKISGRVKSTFSIYKKIKNRSLIFEDINDLYAIRIIVKSGKSEEEKISNCYKVHSLMSERFSSIKKFDKDSIAVPRSSGYRAIHKTIIFPLKNKDKAKVEIQIKTELMHEEAEIGNAAHWLYKEGKSYKDDIDERLTSLRRDIFKEAENFNELIKGLKLDTLFPEEVFIFTPKYDVRKLPKKSTPIDFAFDVHTDIGYHCIGAKINRKIIPLDYELQSGDSVEILTSTKQNPRADWLKIVKTSKARSHIKKFLKESFIQQNLKSGSNAISKQFKKLSTKRNSSQLKKKTQSQGSICQDIHGKIEQSNENFLFKNLRSKEHEKTNFVYVQGLNNLMINFANCCQPKVGDNIFGFITKNRGILIHRSDCKNILKLMQDPERSIDVKWDIKHDEQLVNLKILAEDRKTFLHDISKSISSTDADFVSFEMGVHNSLIHTKMNIKVANEDQLTKVLNKISKIHGVISVERLNGVQ